MEKNRALSVISISLGGVLDTLTPLEVDSGDDEDTGPCAIVSLILATALISNSLTMINGTHC